MWNFNLIPVLIYFHIFVIMCGFFSVGVGAQPLVDELKTNENLSESEIIDYIHSINFTRNFIHEWTNNRRPRSNPEDKFIEDNDWFILGFYCIFIVLAIVSWIAGALWYIFQFFRYGFYKIWQYVDTKIYDYNRRQRRLFNKKWTLPRENEVGGELRALHHTTIIPLFIFIEDFESRDFGPTASNINVGNSEEQSSNQEQEQEREPSPFQPPPKNPFWLRHSMFWYKT